MLDVNMEYDKINGKVGFRELDHYYGNIEDSSIKYTSVTTLIGKYENEFNIYQIFGHSLSYPSVYEYEINENWAMLDCGKSFVLDCKTGIISPSVPFVHATFSATSLIFVTQ